jgi:hypothetical protein
MPAGRGFGISPQHAAILAVSAPILKKTRLFAVKIDGFLRLE